MKRTVELSLEPLGRVLRVPRGSSLQTVLAEHGVEFPCGGRGGCGACRVRVLRGELEAMPDPAHPLSARELAEGWRLACRSRASADASLEIGQWAPVILADEREFAFVPRPGLGIAVDLGTTTLVAQLVDFASGRVLGVRSALNPQAARGADVMSRIEAAVTGGARDELVAEVRRAVGGLVTDLLSSAARGPEELERVIVAGNTAMHHFFCGLDPAPLASWPFEVIDGGVQHFHSGRELGWPIDVRVTFLPCLGGFVGSDLLCGILALGIHRRETPCVLVDLGTNGEIVVGDRHRILCASAAAGPAFEAGGIGMGMRATTGAVHAVSVEAGVLRASVLGGGEARGLCGSGLVDAVAAALDLGLLEPSGRLAGGRRSLRVAAEVEVSQRDIRQLQLAKAAIAAGLRLLTRRYGESALAAAPVHLAGAFGNYVDPGRACRIGLLGGDPTRIRPAGNTALLGAKIALLGGDGHGDHHGFEALLARVEHVPLAGDPAFPDVYVEEMPFPGGR